MNFRPVWGTRRCPHFPMRRRGVRCQGDVAGQDHDPHHVLQPAAVRRPTGARNSQHSRLETAMVSHDLIR